MWKIAHITILEYYESYILLEFSSACLSSIYFICYPVCSFVSWQTLIFSLWETMCLKKKISDAKLSDQWHAICRMPSPISPSMSPHPCCGVHHGLEHISHIYIATFVSVLGTKNQSRVTRLWNCKNNIFFFITHKSRSYHESTGIWNVEYERSQMYKAGCIFPNLHLRWESWHSHTFRTRETLIGDLADRK